MALSEERALVNDVRIKTSIHFLFSTISNPKRALPVLAPLVDLGKVVVVSAFYDFDTGLVELLDMD